MLLFEGQDFFSDPDFPFYIERYTIKAKEIVYPHSHDFVEFVYVVTGGAVHEWADKSYPLAPGDVFAIEPNTHHSYTGSDDGDTIVFNILFHRKLFEHEMESLLKFPGFIDFFYLAPFLRNNAPFVPYTALNASQRHRMESHLLAINEEFLQRQEGFAIIIKNRWIECLVLLSRYHGENRQRGPRSKELTKDDWISSILGFVEQHCDQELSLAHLANTCRMSVSSFTAKFKQATGMSLLDYKHAAQIRRACRMLEQSDMKIAGIAYEAGFNDISFFNRIFRKYAGRTPKEYRAQYRQGE